VLPGPVVRVSIHSDWTSRGLALISSLRIRRRGQRHTQSGPRVLRRNTGTAALGRDTREVPLLPGTGVRRDPTGTPSSDAYCSLGSGDSDSAPTPNGQRHDRPISASGNRVAEHPRSPARWRPRGPASGVSACRRQRAKRTYSTIGRCAAGGPSRDRGCSAEHRTAVIRASTVAVGARFPFLPRADLGTLSALTST
jgi:hypothetical protein